MMARPKTQAQIKKEKEAREQQDKVVVRAGRKQAVPIQLSREGLDFYRGQQTVLLGKDKSMAFNKGDVMMMQLENLAKRGLIRYRIVKHDEK